MRRRTYAIYARCMPVFLAGAMACAACSSLGEAPASDNQVMGTYETVLTAASGGGERQVGVMLLADRTAAVSSAFSGRPSRFMVNGKWERIGNQITINLGGPRAERLVFEYEDGKLIAKDWDPRTWGSEGPGTLQKQ